MASEAWLINPRRKRRRAKTTRRRRRNPGHYTAKAPSVRRRTAVRSPLAANPRRRRRRTSSRRRRASYRRNPPQLQTIFNQLIPVTTGFIATKFVGNMVAPMLGNVLPGNGGPFMRIAMKVGIAYLTAWGAENFMGHRFFMPVMLGGSIEAIQDFTREFVSPMFPALAAYEYPLSVYYEAPPEIVAPEEAIEAAASNNNANGVGAYYDRGFRVMT